MLRGRSSRGIALVTVLFASALLLVLVAVLVDLGTIQLRRSSEDLRSLQGLAGTDAGTAWVRGVLAEQHGSIDNTIAHLAATQGKRRFMIDDRTYILVAVSLMPAIPLGSGGNHYDVYLEQNPQVTEVPAQVQSSSTVFVDGAAVSHRSTTTLLRVFPAHPYSEVVGYIDDGGPVGIDSPGDAGGQQPGANLTELLVNAYTQDPSGRHNAGQWGTENWSDGNSQGPGPLP